MYNSSQLKPFLAHKSEDSTRFQTVKEHLEGTAGLAVRFARDFGGEEQARLAGLLHDIGKYSAGFQRRLEGGPKVDHSTAGAKEAVQLGQLDVSFAVAGHHGGLPDGGAQTDAEGSGTLFGRLKKRTEACDGWKKEITLPKAVRRPEWTMADPLDMAFYIRMLFSCLVDADYLDTEAFMAGDVPRGGYAALPELLEKLEGYLKGFENPQTDLNRERCGILRQCIRMGEESAPGLFSLTVPTGGGKTVSSLAFALYHAVAHGLKRVIYVIPYTSIIDQTADTFGKILGPENVVEHHSGADYSAEEKRQERERQTDPEAERLLRRKLLATENWDAPVIVTTAVQFFESLYGNSASRCRKLHNLAESVIIFDEAQTLPVGYLLPCIHAIGQLVRHYGATAVLCTATQPALGPLFQDRCGLEMREICPETGRLYAVFRRTSLRQAGSLSEEALANELSASPQVLCVVNRRASAQRIYQLLEGEGRYCLTTLLCPADRKRQLEEIRYRLKEKLPCRVVSTSLIEAGVDVDFPAAWREEAGLDSVLQTAGRCNREGKNPAAESLVRVFRLEGQRVPVSVKQETATARLIFDGFGDPASPEAIEAYFTGLRQFKGEGNLDKEKILDAFKRGFEGRLFPFQTVAEKFHLIDSPTKAVYIPLEGCQDEIEQLRQGQVSRALFRKLGQYAVSIYPKHLEALEAAGAVEPAGGDGYILRDLSLYSGETGLKMDVETGLGIFC